MQDRNIVVVMLHGTPLVGKSSLAHFLMDEFRTYYPGKEKQKRKEERKKERNKEKK